METAALIAAIGYMVQRKPNGNGNRSGAKPTEFWEVRFREIHDGIRQNHEQLRELRWNEAASAKSIGDLSNAIQSQGKALGDVANAIQRLLERRTRP